MFCRLGSDEESRPVAATVWWKEEWTREFSSASWGRASTYVPFSFEISRYSMTSRAIGNPCSASSVRTSTPVEETRVFAVFLPTGYFIFSNRICPSFTGELTLNCSPASCQIRSSSARSSRSMRADIPAR